MSGRIPRQFIDDLLVRVDIVDVIDSHVPLKKMGANYSARCPFHNEKTPSFSVNRNKQFFHCFGCHASGNVISFLMDFNHLTFVEAIEELATFCGVEIPYEKQSSHLEPQQKNKLIDLQQLMQQIATFYSQQLKQNQNKDIAVDYLKGRGILGETARNFMLGYAPEDWQILSPHFDTQLLCEAGMLAFKNDNYYERFRQRIMFPIRNKRGHIIGFGGRILKDDPKQPKYLNSPETPLFHKGNEVYGLYELLKQNSRPARILVVEGYMDVVTLAQYGVNYAVAALGTSLSATQLQLLFRSSPEVILCFDGDKAGKEAAWRAMDAVFSVINDNRQVRVLLLPIEHDPDSLIRIEGVDAFTQRIEQADILSDYFFSHFQETLNLASIEGRAKLVNQAKPYLLKLADCFFKEMTLKKLHELSQFDISPTLERETLAAAQPSQKHNSSQKQTKNTRHSLERLTLAMLVQYPKLIEKLQNNPIDWNTLDFSGIDIFKAIVHTIITYKPETTAQLLEFYRDKPEEKVLNALAALPILVSEKAVESEFSGALMQFIVQAKQTRLEKLLAQETAVGLNDEEKEILRQLLLR
jgi:DNA primase